MMFQLYGGGYEGSHIGGSAEHRGRRLAAFSRGLRLLRAQQSPPPRALLLSALAFVQRWVDASRRPTLHQIAARPPLAVSSHPRSRQVG